jgi:maleamate amidohydrolase
MTNMVSGQDDEAFFRARGFGQRIGFGLRPVILVVDLVNAFTDPERPLGSDLSAEIMATNQLIDAGRSRGVPILFTTVSYDDAGARDAGIWLLKQKGTLSLLSQGDGPDLDLRLHAVPGDPLLKKKYASCFFGTDLASRLVAMGTDTLLITGGTTSGCVRATAVDCVQYGFRPMVVEEAVGDRSAAAHRQALFDLNQKYADVVALDESLDYLNSLEVRA